MFNRGELIMLCMGTLCTQQSKANNLYLNSFFFFLLISLNFFQFSNNAL